MRDKVILSKIQLFFELVSNFEYGNIQINNGDIKYGTRIDTRNVKITSRKGKKHLTLNHFIN